MTISGANDSLRVRVGLRSFPFKLELGAAALSPSFSSSLSISDRLMSFWIWRVLVGFLRRAFKVDLW